LDQLQKRLGLPAEYCWCELISENPEVHRIGHMLRETVYNKKAVKMEELIIMIQDRVDMNDPINHQTMARYQLLNQWFQGKIKREDWTAKVKNILEETASYDEIMSEPQPYLTHMEEICMQNMVYFERSDTEDLKKILGKLYMIYHEYDLKNMVESYIRQYDMMMDFIANKAGDLGAYKESEEISNKIIYEDLLSRRLSLVANGIYNLFWINEQMITKKMRNPNTETDLLLLCVTISQYAKREKKAKFYQDKMVLRNMEKL
jgi:hypothetical protein